MLEGSLVIRKNDSYECILMVDLVDCYVMVLRRCI
jgi:hypothetical protein